MSKALTPDEFRLLRDFEAVRDQLRDDQLADRLDQPLGLWVRQDDRRLPLAFLGRSVGELIEMSFPDISATPGIGVKKIDTMINLLRRAIDQPPPGGSRPASAAAALVERGVAATNGVERDLAEGDFDFSTVSELDWSLFRKTVQRHGLEHLPLGRLAPTLRHVPTALWAVPLGGYVDKSLEEIRQLRTHGSKRLQVIVEVFHHIHSVLGQVPDHTYLSVAIEPRIASELSNELRLLEQGEEPLTRDQIKERFARPLLEQIEHDRDANHRSVAEARIGFDADAEPIRLQAAKMGLTRARVYQLIEECSGVLAIRWPEGAARVAEFRERTADRLTDSQARAFFDDLATVFFSP